MKYHWLYDKEKRKTQGPFCRCLAKHEQLSVAWLPLAAADRSSLLHTADLRLELLSLCTQLLVNKLYFSEACYLRVSIDVTKYRDQKAS